MEEDPSELLSSFSTQFLRGLLALGDLQLRNTLTQQAMSAEHIYHTYVDKAFNVSCTKHWACLCKITLTDEYSNKRADLHAVVTISFLEVRPIITFNKMHY